MFISIFLLTALQPKRVKLTITYNFVSYLRSSRAVHIKMFQNDEKYICAPQFMFNSEGALRINLIFLTQMCNKRFNLPSYFKMHI